MWYLRKTGKNVFHWSFVYKRSFNSTKQRVFWNSCFFLQPRPWKCTKNGEKGLPDLHWCPYKDTYWHLNVCCYLNFDIYLCILPILNVAFQGKRFVKQNISRLTKNHRCDTADSDDKSPRMYEEPGNERCPVNSFEKYLAKSHPVNKWLWQKPREGFEEEDSVWFCNVPVGKNTLGSIMQKISQEANLSKMYTNHCIMATCISVLDECGSLYKGNLYISPGWMWIRSTAHHRTIRS